MNDAWKIQASEVKKRVYTTEYGHIKGHWWDTRIALKGNISMDTDRHL